MPPKKLSATATAEPPRRTSRRISSTPKKSRYFEDSETEDVDLPPKKRGRPSTKPKLQKEESEEQYKDEDSEEDYQEEPEENEPEEEEEEDDEDAPPRVTFIPLEKMRDTGGVDYEDFKIHNNTLLFLRDLKANNKRPWLKCKLGQQRSMIPQRLANLRG